jgi:hypothetical protein
MRRSITFFFNNRQEVIETRIMASSEEIQREIEAIAIQIQLFLGGVTPVIREKAKKI